MGIERIYHPPEKLHEVLGTAVHVNQISGYAYNVNVFRTCFLPLNYLEMPVNGDFQLCMCVVAIIVVNIFNDVLEVRAVI